MSMGCLESAKIEEPRAVGALKDQREVALMMIAAVRVRAMAESVDSPAFARNELVPMGKDHNDRFVAIGRRTGDRRVVREDSDGARNSLAAESELIEDLGVALGAMSARVARS